MAAAINRSSVGSAAVMASIFRRDGGRQVPMACAADLFLFSRGCLKQVQARFMLLARDDYAPEE